MTYLLHKRGENGRHYEGRENDCLHSGLCRIGLVERESNEETGNRAQAQLRNDVARHPPVLLEATICAFPDLRG